MLSIPFCYPVLKNTMSKLVFLAWGTLGPPYSNVIGLLRGGLLFDASSAKDLLCRRNASIGTQFMADLPPGRLQTDKPPFSHVGIDYFGLIFVSLGKSQVKRYGCIFTRLTARAVRIEISHNLTSDSFLNALGRFIARKRAPKRD